MNVPILRVARASDDLNGLLRFYCDGLGLIVLCRFENHAGFDGVMLGQEGAPYHFEFTKKRGHTAARSPTVDDLVVLYYPDIADWHAA
ncbi:MAG: VOC family protein, partial [Pseudolabrys sp.]